MFINKKNSIAYVSILITIIISFVALYKYVVALDYRVYVSIPCIGVSGECFVSYAECENTDDGKDDCVADLVSNTENHYMYAYIDADMINKTCSGTTDVGCLASLCVNSPDSCEQVVCTEENISESEMCI